MNQSGWILQNFILGTMYVHRFYPTAGCYTDFPFKSRLYTSGLFTQYTE